MGCPALASRPVHGPDEEEVHLRPVLLRVRRPRPRLGPRNLEFQTLKARLSPDPELRDQEAPRWVRPLVGGLF